jgi:hypothetical protein
VPDRFAVFRPRVLSDAPAPQYVELAHAAENSRLALYVGAGVSVSAPTLLPTSGEFLRLLAPLAEREFAIKCDVDGADDALRTLEELADEAEGNGVLPSFQETAALAARFRDALPNYGHCVIAMLLREGAVTVFSANWDRCIESGSAVVGFHLDPTITEADRVARFSTTRFHKVHGCATQPGSLLISSSQLDAPPHWVVHEVGAAVGAGTVVFVGLGTVGGYVRRRVEQLVAAIDDPVPVWVADPLPADTWTDLLDRAGDTHVLSVDSNTFFDDLLRAYVRHAIVRLLVAAVELDAVADAAPTRPAVERLESALATKPALDIMTWLRAGAGGVRNGSPFTLSGEARSALLALARIAGDAAIACTGSRDRVVVTAGAAFIELAVWPEERSDYVLARERYRTTERQDRGCYEKLDWPIFHICLGQRGSLPDPRLPIDIGGASDPKELAGDLVETVPVHVWVSAESVLQGREFPTVPV